MVKHVRRVPEDRDEGVDELVELILSRPREGAIESAYPGVLEPGDPAAPTVTTFTDLSEVTLVVASAPTGASVLSAIGTAKRHPSDPFDWEVGAALAQGRAFKALSEGLFDYAQARGIALGLGDVLKEDDRA